MSVDLTQAPVTLPAAPGTPESETATARAVRPSPAPRSARRERWSRWWRALTDPAPVGRPGPDLHVDAVRRDALWSRDPRMLR